MSHGSNKKVPIIPDYLLRLELRENSYEYRYSSSNISTGDVNNSARLHYNNSLDGNLNRDGNSTTSADFILPQDIINENSKVGWLLSSKAIVQLFIYPLVGVVCCRIGYVIPLYLGSFVMFLSSLVFAFCESYALLFLARSIHGLGTSCYQVAGLGMIAAVYPKDRERSRAMGIALGGQGFGILIGYPLGGSLYAFVGKMVPFLITAVIVAFTGVLILIIYKPTLNLEPRIVGTPLHVILRDPYILLVAGLLMIPEMAIAILEPTLPIWLADYLHVEEWQIGLVFLPDSIGQLIASNVFGIASYRIGRWICGLTSLLSAAACLIILPFATKIVHLILPHFGVGFSIGIMNATMLPLLALLVDQRHRAEYGMVYAIGQLACSLGYAIGPSIGGQLAGIMGFPWLIRGMGIFCLLACPFTFFLRQLPCDEEHKAILKDDHLSHASYSVRGEKAFEYNRFSDTDSSP
ncbi:synaptic vesicular amine transporter-like [Tubulanus polymorphus]|uniref:synaptic vesicular amine transporter-like n=1 Tax=Tubulanus polymorphus TaxID=672921 RepID=UPI003DA62C6C